MGSTWWDCSCWLAEESGGGGDKLEVGILFAEAVGGEGWGPWEVDGG
jgi:hypothetical protein